MLVTASLACHRNRDNLLAGEYRRRLQEIIADNLSKAGGVELRVSVGFSRTNNLRRRRASGQRKEVCRS
jgi:hypothetical protein